MEERSGKYAVWFRKKIEVNTDPQRRCYDGHHFSSKMIWTEWAGICVYSSKEIAEQTAKTFKEINPLRQYKVLPEGEKPRKWQSKTNKNN